MTQGLHPGLVGDARAFGGAMGRGERSSLETPGSQGVVHQPTLHSTSHQAAAEGAGGMT